MGTKKPTTKCCCACSLLKKQKKIPKKNFPLPQYFKMMVLLLYIQNQDKQKMTKKKNQIKFPEKKNPNPATTQNNPKNSLNNYKKFCHTPQFFLQVMNKILERKKITKRKQNKQEEKK